MSSIEEALSTMNFMLTCAIPMTHKHKGGATDTDYGDGKDHFSAAAIAKRKADHAADVAADAAEARLGYEQSLPADVLRVIKP